MVLDNLSEYNETTWIHQTHEDGIHTILMIRFFKLGNLVICTGQAMARNNFKYQPIVPQIYRPKRIETLTGQNSKEQNFVATSSIRLNPSGELYTDYPYNDEIFWFTTMYKI